MSIPFYRPPKVLEKDELLVDWAKVYESGKLSNGENCRKLEEEIKRIHKCDYVVSCSSATSGLWLLLQVLGARKILMPAFTWKSVGFATSPYKRLWMDIDRETWLPNVFTKWKSFDTLLFQHTFGNIESLPTTILADTIIDAAYSLGGSFQVYGGAVISLSPTKTVTSCEGGLVLLNDKHKADALTEYRDSCSRLSELNAIVALHYLEKLHVILARKKQIFDYYNSKLPFEHQTILAESTCGYYGMLLPPDLENSKFKAEGYVYMVGDVECRVRYNPLVKGLTNTDYVAKHLLCLPCYHDVDEKKVAETLLEVLT